MEEPFLSEPQTQNHIVVRRAIGTIKVMLPLAIGLVGFGLLAATMRSVQDLSEDFHNMSATQQKILMDIQMELNVTETDGVTLDDLYNQFEKMYDFAKLVCTLQPQYKEYCKLL